MRSVFHLVGFVAVMLFLMASCVDPEDQTLRQRVDIVVVDGSITNLIEAQVVRLNRSRSDPLTGRFGTLPLAQARVEILVDSAQVVPLRETEPGRYQAPAGFAGQVGHLYQLRFTLKEGTRYQSTSEVMPAVPAIMKVSSRFNPISLPDKRFDGMANAYQGANDFFVDWQDPIEQHNYYRWDWKLWEKQDWCRTCSQGFYYINSPIDENILYEDCYSNEQTSTLPI